MERGEIMNLLNRKSYHAPERPIKILQFGEGSFLRFYNILAL